MVTNFRDPKNIHAQAPSRGKLVTDFLRDNTTGEKYLEKLIPHARKYNGFSLIAGTVDALYYFSNYKDGIILLNSGLFGLSNHLLETPWPKVEKGKSRIQELLKPSVVQVEALYEVLSDEAISSDDHLPDTGVGVERERALSAAFIKSPGYGTRSSTVVMVDYNDNVSFHERVFNPENSRFSYHSFQYTIG